MHAGLSTPLDPRNGRDGEAIKHWQRYLELDSGSPWARIARAHLDGVEPPDDPR